MDSYTQLINDQNVNFQEIKAAFVTFKSMEGAARVTKAYAREKSLRKRLYFSKTMKDFEYLRFKNRLLKVKPTMDPPMILWENLNVPRRT